MTDSQPLVVLGAGGHAREVADLARACASRDRLALVAFATTERGGPDVVAGIRVLTITEAAREWRGAAFIAGVGDPSARESVAQQAETAGLRAVSLLHPSAHISTTARISDQGVAVFAGAVVSSDVQIDAHVHLNFNATVSHDCAVGAFSLVSPGAHVAGNVQIGRRVLVGIGATILPGAPASPLRIGDGALIGAGACVTNSVPSGSTVVGVPARPLQRRRAT